MENSAQGSKENCFREWINLQEEDLLELLQALNLNKEDEYNHTAELTELVEKNIRHFEEYASQRSNLARDNVSAYFSPTWCTSLECSMLWAGGCRPSIYIRLVYALCGKEILSYFNEFGIESKLNGRLGELSASQLSLINNLQLKTIREEDTLSKRLASLQEEIADNPIALIAQDMQTHDVSIKMDDVLNAHSVSMMNMLREADILRLNTMKELIDILTPIQAVDFLAAGKKLSRCVHAWGRTRDFEHGRN